ncbi:response regulator transcription factor [Chryseobacterium populi]|uniref:Response regulator containing a CheY-like receiver domain and an HTH DNA-binding domain n=1 Tax=Chryseobacterium populi TaxID=1144316 RepID=J3CE48_9FLAO|nr:response regulator transcription factor [Chryseobacterium populi]EJL69621.1 response regulator containing a CheY-like receiver domain and an HTH DNA-binding domain [Chryseobacterium populi]
MNKKILIADDHYVVRLGTAMVLENHFPDISIDYAENYEEVKSKLHKEKFDLIMLDIDMEGSTFRHMIKELKMIQEDIMIIIFTSYKESAAIEYIQEGAEGYINKLSGEKNVIKAVQSVFEDGYYYSPKLVKELTSQPQKKDISDLLSEREFQVFKLLIEGNGNLEIANILEIHMTTASTYKRRVYAKLGVNNLVDLLKVSNSKNYH